MAAGPSATSMSANIQNTSVVSANDGRDGWDNEDWGSLEEEPNEELEEKGTNDMNHITASRSNSNSQSHSSTSGSGIHNNNIMNNISPTKNNGENILTTSANSNWDNYGSSWNDDEFEAIDEGGTG